MEYRTLPDLNGWAALRAVVEHGGVSAAAKALCISQSAVTKRLRAVETCYAMPLTERVAGRLRLTAAGEKVYALAVKTLEQQRAVQEDLRRQARGQTCMRLAATHDISEYLLPDLLVKFHERFPDYRIDLRIGYFRHIRNSLVAGISNLALLEAAPDHPEIMVQRWQDDELWLVCGPGHSLAATTSLPVTQLGGLLFVAREGGTSLREMFDKVWVDLGMKPLEPALEMGPTRAMMDTLARGVYVGFLPRFIVESKILAGELHHIDVMDLNLGRALWIARNTCDLQHPIADAFIDMMRESAIGRTDLPN